MSRGSGVKAIADVCGISQPGGERHGVMHVLSHVKAIHREVTLWTEIDQDVRTGSEQ